MKYNFHPDGKKCEIRTPNQKYIGHVWIEGDTVKAQPVDGVMWLPVMEALDAIQTQQAMSKLSSAAERMK